MAAYPYLVQIAWNTVETFIGEWQNTPYRWSKEIDIQVELASRISKIYQMIGYDTLLGNYNNAISGFESKQYWSRVTCEPSIKYTFSDNKEYTCYPDIVIWDDIDNPDSPPDSEGEKNWPILWACELKYRVDKTVKKNDDWDDPKKLRCLVEQNIVKFGCCLEIICERASSGNGIKWNKDEIGKSLWICDVKLPSL